MFFPSNVLFISVSTDCSFFNMRSYCLNLDLALYLCADVFLQSLITLTVNFLSIKVQLGCFLVYLLVHVYVFYYLKDILM